MVEACSSVGGAREWAAAAVWAKSRRLRPTWELADWLPLKQHLADSAEVALLLWDNWMPDQVRRRIVAEVGTPDQARMLLFALAGCHDVGKATPAFQVKDETLAARVRQAGLALPRGPIPDAGKLKHGLAGQVILTEALEELCLPQELAARLGVVVGGHHGVPPSHGALSRARHLHAARGGQDWKEVQRSLLDPSLRIVSQLLDEGASLALSQPAQVLMSGAVIMSDWIASAEELFPCLSANEGPGTWAAARLEGTARARAAKAWAELGLPPPLTFPRLGVNWESSFAVEFGLPEGSLPRQPQRATVAASEGLVGGGLVIQESEMGSGKTEAALLAARVLGASTGAGGVFVALPTRATSDAMLPRVTRWADAVAVGHQRASVFLAHGKSWLNEDHAGMPVIRLGGIEQDEPQSGSVVRASSERALRPVGLVAHDWLSGRKRGMLADVVVGTVDQVLFAALKSKHLALRHLALAGKVVIIDEVHAYDAYMSRYLRTALTWLGAYGVPVVLLSATLAPSSRAALIEAYRGAPAIGRPRKPWRSTDQKVTGGPGVPPPGDQGIYPRLEAVARSGHGSQVMELEPGPSREVTLERIGPDDRELVGVAAREMSDGGCILVVRNTVREVQSTARALTSAFGDKYVTVAHSRFVATHRAINDRDLVARFGPADARPERAIVVASQVAEQSLDVDFDLLVSDVAPIDLLLQRIGRMHRHSGRNRPGRLMQPRLLLRGVRSWEDPLPQPLAGTARVYSPWALHRTLAVLRGRERLVLPTDIAELIRQVYEGPAPLVEEWGEREAQLLAEHQRELAAKEARARTFLLGMPRGDASLVGWLDEGAGNVDDTAAGLAQVRDSADSVEVILLQRYVSGAVGLLVGERGLEGVDLAGSTPIESPHDYRVALSTLALPRELSTLEVIGELERRFFLPALQESTWLAGELTLILDPDGRVELAGRRWQYTRRYGWEEARDA